MSQNRTREVITRKEKYGLFFYVGIIFVLFSDSLDLFTMLKAGPLVLGGIFSLYGGLGLLFEEYFKK